MKAKVPASKENESKTAMNENEAERPETKNRTTLKHTQNSASKPSRHPTSATSLSEAAPECPPPPSGAARHITEHQPLDKQALHLVLHPLPHHTQHQHPQKTP
jgi:hypothetical protein